MLKPGVWRSYCVQAEIERATGRSGRLEKKSPERCRLTVDPGGRQPRATKKEMQF